MAHLLIVEDDELLRDGLSAQLMQAGHRIDTAADGEQALACLQNDAFEGVVLDLGLPDGSGVDVVAALRESQPEAQSVVVTIHDDDDHLFPALQCGADGYLLKEHRFELLVEELQKIVRGQPPLSPAIARRLLSHFRQGGPSESAPSPQPSARSGVADTNSSLARCIHSTAFAHKPFLT